MELQSILVTKRQEGWIKFSIGNVVESWLNHPNKNFGLVVVAEDMQHRPLNTFMLFDSYNCSAQNSNAMFFLHFKRLQVTDRK